MLRCWFGFILDEGSTVSVFGKGGFRNDYTGESGKLQVLIYLIKISLTTPVCQSMGGDFFRSCYRRAKDRGLRTHVQML